MVVLCRAEELLCGRSSSAAKNADADFKIAFARRSSRSSRTSAAIRSASPVEVPGRWPASTSACWTNPPQRLVVDPALVADPCDRTTALPRLLARLEHQLHSPLTKLRRVLPRCGHDSHLSKVASLHQSRAVQTRGRLRLAAAWMFSPWCQGENNRPPGRPLDPALETGPGRWPPSWRRIGATDQRRNVNSFSPPSATGGHGLQRSGPSCAGTVAASPNPPRRRRWSRRQGRPQGNEPPLRSHQPSTWRSC